MKQTCFWGRFYLSTTSTARSILTFLRLHLPKILSVRCGQARQVICSATIHRFSRHPTHYDASSNIIPDEYGLTYTLLLSTTMHFSYLRKRIPLRASVLATALFLSFLLSLHVIISLTLPPFYKRSIAYTNETLPISPALPPPLPPITLLTSAYKGQYSEARQLELSLVALLNQRLSSISRYHRLFEHGMNFTQSKRVTGRILSPTEDVTYRALFAEAQHLGGVVVLANADIYFDESILCASMLSRRTVLALSRHPSPDCYKHSSRDDRGREPVDFCEGYHPRRHASHDVFIFVPPVPLSFLNALGDLKVNRFGAENVVISLLKAEQFDVVNPCSNIHAFHQHCTGERAPSAKSRMGNIADARRQFGATFQSGFVHGREWMDMQFSGRFGGVDCLAFGLMHNQYVRNR